MCMSTQRVTKARLMFRKYVHRPVGDSGLKPAQCRTQKSIEKGGTHLALSGRRSGWSVSIVSYGFHWKRNVWPTAWSVISYWRPLSTCWCRCPPVELISSMRRSCWATRLKRGSIPKGHPPETKHNNETNQWTIFFFGFDSWTIQANFILSAITVPQGCRLRLWPGRMGCRWNHRPAYNPTWIQSIHHTGLGTQSWKSAWNLWNANAAAPCPETDPHCLQDFEEIKISS